MSNYQTSIKKDISTWLDSAGSMLSSPRLKNESLFDYQQRLIDLVRNKPSSTIEGLNYSAGREFSLPRKHVLTVNTTSTKPLIKVTSKYIYFYDDTTLDFKLDLYSHTWGDLYLAIGSSTFYSVDYYNDECQNYFLTKTFYSSNKKSYKEYLGPSKCNILSYQYLDTVYIDNPKMQNIVDSIADIDTVYDYYIDYENAIIFTGDIASGSVVYSYYEMPYKLYYNPISFYPLNDEDIDYLIKDQVNTADGLTNLILNSKGSDFINEILAVLPTSLGN